MLRPRMGPAQRIAPRTAFWTPHPRTEQDGRPDSQGGCGASFKAAVEPAHPDTISAQLTAAPGNRPAALE